MIFVKRTSSQSINDFEKAVNSKIRTTGNYGINWIYNKNNKIVLYYESGEKTSRGTPQILKSYFFGFYKSNGDGIRLNGIIISGPVITGFIVLALILEFIFLGAAEILASCLLYIPALLWFFFGERKNRLAVSEYLNSILENNL